jgi:hypothetical protein
MAFEELKERQGVMWGAAPFENYVWLAEMHPFDWGREERVRELLGGAFDLELVERDNPQTGESGEGVWQAFLDTYGPARVLSNSLGAELARAMADFFEQYRDGDGVHQPRAYHVVLGTRR